jgi:hypothetical protein
MSGVPLTAEDLLAGAEAIYDIPVASGLLSPGANRGEAGCKVRVKPLSIGQFLLIMKAAKEDASLIPLLIVKESLVEPQVSVGQVKQMSVGLVSFLVEQIRAVSGLSQKKNQ